MTYRPRETRTLSDLAERKLRDAIISGELPPGTRLLLQEQVERLEMSSVPIREALRYLERSGLVERRPHYGTSVAPISLEDLHDTYAVRMELETFAVGQAVQKMTDDLLEQITAILEEYTETWQQDSDHTRRLHRQLHFSIYAVAGSPWLQRLVPMLWDNSERYRRLSIENRPKADILADHRLLVELCAARAPAKAVAALRTHLRKNIQSATKGLRKQQGPSSPN